MDTATWLLVIIGLFGAFDVAYFHSLRGRLSLQRGARREAWIHVGRGVIYAAQFLVVPNLRLSGAWYPALVALFALDIAIAVADVHEEPRARAALGGLFAGEYAMHILLSVLVGALLGRIAEHSWAWHTQPTALTFEAHGPLWLRLSAALMALGALAVAATDAIVLWCRIGEPPEPLHVRLRVHAALEELWTVTQDHHAHPRWDYRFSRIEMEGERIGTGTNMRYERDLAGLTVRGFGRYKLHRPMRQSTFEFWSDDPRSLIARGAGLWLYRQVSSDVVELSTSFTYRVRWGLFGRVIDALLFRPLMQRLTEASFRRLGRLYFAEGAPQVLGRRHGKPLRFTEPCT